MEEELEITFINHMENTCDLGEQYEGVDNMFYDWFMVIDFVERRKQQKSLMMVTTLASFLKELVR